MTSRQKDLYSAVFFLLLAVVLYWQSYAIVMSKADALGPQFFPRLVSYAMAALAILQLVRYFRAAKKPDTETVTPWKFNMPLFATIAILIAYVVLLKTVGFIILTALYLFCQIFLLLPKGAFKKKKTLLVTALVSILIPVGIYMLFYHVFSIFLPAGILG